jgi:hypothetical protein
MAWAERGREAAEKEEVVAAEDTGNCDLVEATVAPVTAVGLAVEVANKGDDKLAKGSRTNEDTAPGRAPKAAGACAAVLGLVAAAGMAAVPI